MAFTYTGSVSQATSGLLTYTDTSSPNGTVTARTLVITDPNMIVLATITMGSLLTTTFNVTTDQYLTFTETLTDNGGPHTITVGYLAVTFYIQQFLVVMKSIGCSCDCSSYKKLNEAGNYFDAANDYAVFIGYGILANTNIIAANTIINS